MIVIFLFVLYVINGLPGAVGSVTTRSMISVSMLTLTHRIPDTLLGQQGEACVGKVPVCTMSRTLFELLFQIFRFLKE